MKFTDLNLSEDIQSAVVAAGFEQPSPIQELTIPLALEGKDVIGQAQTGTGKTAAFGLPTLDKIRTEENTIQALVIAPTRELAVQSQEELFRFGRDKGVKVRSVYGGSSIEKQIKALRSGAHIVVGTPGRLLDLIKRKALKLNNIETLILDEADEMLNMGFLEDIEAIISRVPEERQTLLFSATMPDAIKRIGVQFMKDPEHVKIKAKELTNVNVDQYFIRVKEQEKFDTMTRLMDVDQPELSIVFGRTKRRVDELTRGLKLRGFRAEGIHGDLDQNKRLRIIRDFNYRGYSARETISRWPSVRAGEDKWIFPYQENADVMFNSALLFEFAVLRLHAEPILMGVPRNCPEYCEAYRLLKFIKYFVPVQDKEIPPTSLLREFLGGSSFKY